MPAEPLDPAALDLAFDVAARRARTGELPFTILALAGAEGAIRTEATTAPGADREVRPDDLCLIASISKPIVAMATLRLVQEGRFGLRTPLSFWLPELRGDDRRTITPWHVMTHTSGLAEPLVAEFVRDGADHAAFVQAALEQPLVTPVGSTYAYATVPWELLALALERTLDQPLDDILEATLLGPLGMRDTTFTPGPRHAHRLGAVRVGEWDGVAHRTGETPEVAAFLRGRYSALRMAGGGLWSTADDLLRFGRAMLRGGELDGVRVLAPALVALATREVTLDGLGRADDRLEDSHYALGWGKPGVANPGSARAFGHSGVTGTRLWVEPDRDLVLAYLTGSMDLPAQVIDETVLAVYGATRDRRA